jgi:general secretion pathway protein C
MWLISLIAVILCSYFLAKITVNLVQYWFTGGSQISIVGSGPIEIATFNDKLSSYADFDPILERNVFDSKAVRVKPGDEKPIVKDEPDEKPVEVNPTGDPVKTSLPIKLISTFSVGSGENKQSSCIISSGRGRRGGEADVYTVDDDDEFAPNTKIVRILFNRVEFINNGRLEYVELEQFAGDVNLNVPPSRAGNKSSGRTTPRRESSSSEDVVEQVSEDKFVVSREELDNAISNLDQLYTQIRAIPDFKNGRPNGLKLLSVNQRSIFGKLGLKRGDVIHQINGLELDIKRGLEIFNQLKNESNIKIDLTRRGQETSLEYEIR